MISTEIYIEDYKLDLLQDISTEFNYTIDDIVDFGSKNTSFSKTINISGTATNNKIFGFVFDFLVIFTRLLLLFIYNIVKLFIYY